MNALGRVTLLEPKFFNRDPRRVARALLGKLLVRKTPRGILRRANCRNRGLSRQRRCGSPRSRGPDGAEFRSFRSSRPRLCLLHLWQSLLPECFLPPRRSARMRSISRPGAGGRHRADGGGARDRDHGGTGVLARPRRDSRPRLPSRAQLGSCRRTQRLRICDNERIRPQQHFFPQEDFFRPGTPDRSPGNHARARQWKNLTSARSDLRLADDGYRVQRVTVTPRIGIVKSAERPLRYFIAGNPFVSGRRR